MTEESDDVEIGEAGPGDAEAIARLVSNFAPTGAEDVSHRLPALVGSGEPPLVARSQGRVVGIVTWHVTPVLHRPKPVGRITYLEVAASHHRRGIGSALVEAVAERVADRGCGAIEVTSNVKLAGAHGFYEALGFDRTSYRFGRPVGDGGR